MENDNQQTSEINEESDQRAPEAEYNFHRSAEIALSVLDLSQRLTQNIISKSTNKFEVLSPISIASALQLALLGAHGKTFNELMDV